MLERKAVTGAGGIIVNFLRPRFGEGILVEFVQKVGA
jgi:lactoylglutathione lyase/methylmalonyl-CoA/ethylmalonyl-CoA epimerase